jgi:hypothetical protein
VKPTAGWSANSYLIFDYQGKDDFKFTGLDVSTNKLVMGHRDAAGWHVDKSGVAPGGVKADTAYNLLLSVNGVNATLVVDNKQVFTHTFQPRVVDGYSYGLNWGLVGVGSNNSRGTFDNVRVQVLPPQLTFESTEDFADGLADLFTGGSSGAWQVADGRYLAAAATGAATSLLDLGVEHLNVASYLELRATLRTDGRAGFVFDRYGDQSFKFAAIDVRSDQVLIGHWTKKGGWAIDAAASRTLEAATDYVLGVALKGSTVSVTVGGQVLLGHAFNAATVDGDFGLLASAGEASFDDVKLKTDDPQFIATAGSNMVASEPSLVAYRGPTLTQAELDSAVIAAMAHWTDVLGNGDPRLAGFGEVRITVADLDGDALGYAEGRSLLIDDDAAGFGWSIHGGRMDLGTVVAHELGHMLGLRDSDPDYPVMDADLEPGAQYAVLPLEFDFNPAGGGSAGTIDWHSESSGDWRGKLSPYAPAKGPKSFSNFSDYSPAQGKALPGSELDPKRTES